MVVLLTTISSQKCGQLLGAMSPPGAGRPPSLPPGTLVPSAGSGQPPGPGPWGVQPAGQGPHPPPGQLCPGCAGHQVEEIPDKRRVWTGGPALLRTQKLIDFGIASTTQDKEIHKFWHLARVSTIQDTEIIDFGVLTKVSVVSFNSGSVRSGPPG